MDHPGRLDFLGAKDGIETGLTERKGDPLAVWTEEGNAQLKVSQGRTQVRDGGIKVRWYKVPVIKCRSSKYGRY